MSRCTALPTHHSATLCRSETKNSLSWRRTLAQQNLITQLSSSLLLPTSTSTSTSSQGRQHQIAVSNKSNAISAKGCAAVLAIGTATPPNCYYQSDFPNFYFGDTKSDHLTDQLKDKFKRICEKSMVRKRYMYPTESMLEENPSLGAYMIPSLDIRHDIAAVGVQKFGKDAVEKAIKEWGQPISEITHLVVHGTSEIEMPGLDYQLAKLLGLSVTIKRFMFYHQGCHAGGSGTVLGLAKDLAENNEGARVLVVCCELSSILSFHGPSDAYGCCC